MSHEQLFIVQCEKGLNFYHSSDPAKKIRMLFQLIYGKSMETGLETKAKRGVNALYRVYEYRRRIGLPAGHS
jgi:hypothetical protein